MEASEVIRQLNLEPLPHEGGFFRQTYRSRIPFPWKSSQRWLGTAIYYLVTPESFSAWHRVEQDELFHFYLGDPVEMVQLTDDGELRTMVLGSDIARGQNPQMLVPGSVWQGLRLVAGGKWALMGATVTPGFDFADFQLGSRRDLLQRFPQHREMIQALTRD